jgi:hypothetical protein
MLNSTGRLQKKAALDVFTAIRSLEHAPHHGKINQQFVAAGQEFAIFGQLL